METFKNNIPVSNLLKDKGVRIPIICPMCTRDIEHVMHLFFDCDFASKCWQKVGLSYDVSAVECAADWLLDKLNTETMDRLIIITAVLTGIWFARNKKVWEKKEIEANIVMKMSLKQIKDWQEVNKMKRLSVIHSNPGAVSMDKWRPPSAGWVKLNVDASIKEGEPDFMVEMVIKNEHGQFIMGRNKRLAGQVSVFEAEAYAVLEALQWMQEMQFKKVVVESDSCLVIQALKQRTEYLVEAGNILGACLRVLHGRNDLIFNHVKKQANRVAHILARIPCLLDCFNLFISPPHCVLEILLYDHPSN